MLQLWWNTFKRHADRPPESWRCFTNTTDGVSVPAQPSRGLQIETTIRIQDQMMQEYERAGEQTFACMFANHQTISDYSYNKSRFLSEPKNEKYFRITENLEGFRAALLSRNSSLSVWKRSNILVACQYIRFIPQDFITDLKKKVLTNFKKTSYMPQNKAWVINAVIQKTKLKHFSDSKGSHSSGLILSYFKTRYFMDK